MVIYQRLPPLMETPRYGSMDQSSSLAGRMAPGSYELTFGDERQTQSTVGGRYGRFPFRFGGKWREKIYDMDMSYEN